MYGTLLEEDAGALQQPAGRLQVEPHQGAVSVLPLLGGDLVFVVGEVAASKNSKRD